MPVASLARDGGSCALARHLVAPLPLGGPLPVDAVPFPISLHLVGRGSDSAEFCAIAQYLENDIRLRSRSGQ
jgi:hypothetical protein